MGYLSQAAMFARPERLLVQIASYNTNLQGIAGLPQDLVDWLAPTLQVSHFLVKERRAPDIVAVGFQELLPLHLGRMFPDTLLEIIFDEIHSFWTIQARDRALECSYPLAD